LIQDQHGQSLIEFALILPVMVLFIAGIFDLGRAFFASITITNAAREGARFGTLNPRSSDGMAVALHDMQEAAVLEALNSSVILSDSDVTITCTFISTGCESNNPLTVTVNYTFDDMIFSFLSPSGIAMERSVEMLVP
jgi:Flp pilus assembly protein TadG